MEPESAQRPHRRKFWTSYFSLALMVSGAVLFPMLASKVIDPNRAMAFWLASPIQVTVGLAWYANLYLRMANSGAVRQAWSQAAEDFASNVRYITVLVAIACLTGVFLDPNPR